MARKRPAIIRVLGAIAGIDMFSRMRSAEDFIA